MVPLLTQFVDSDILFGNPAASLNGTVNKIEKKPSGDEMHGLVDDMDGRELERIIEIKMTELALVEIVEGAEEAVNGSNELLSLFSRLFGHLGVGRDETPRSKGLIPPKSSAGTVKSLRGSIFGRKRHEPSTSTQIGAANGVPSVSQDDLARHSSHTTEAPTIHVTDEDTRNEKETTLPFSTVTQSFSWRSSRSQTPQEGRPPHEYSSPL